MRALLLTAKGHDPISIRTHHPSPQPAPAAWLGTHLGQKPFSWTKFHWNSPDESAQPRIARMDTNRKFGEDVLFASLAFIRGRAKRWPHVYRWR